MVAAALLSLPRAYKNLHGFKDFVRSAHVSVHEMLVVDLEEPMIFLVLFDRPMSAIQVFELLIAPFALPPSLGNRSFSLLLFFLACKPCQRLILAKQGGFDLGELAKSA